MRIANDVYVADVGMHCDVHVMSAFVPIHFEVDRDTVADDLARSHVHLPEHQG